MNFTATRKGSQIRYSKTGYNATQRNSGKLDTLMAKLSLGGVRKKIGSIDDIIDSL